MIDYPLIDSHVHMCNTDLLSYSWTSRAPSLNRTVLPDDLFQAAAPYRIDQFVFVEVNVDLPQYLKEADWIAALARAEPKLAGMVASVPLELGAEIAGDLDQLCQHDILRSIRRLIQGQPDPDFCVQPDFIAGLKLLGERDVAF
ncbi:MAG: amidohydrolase family protein, partial [Alphaproteobacteria bacterium]